MIKKIRVTVACINANGEPDFYCCILKTSDEGIDNGYHYQVAKQHAADEDFENPMIAYDPTDTKHWDFITLFDWDNAPVFEAEYIEC